MPKELIIENLLPKIVRNGEADHMFGTVQPYLQAFLLRVDHQANMIRTKDQFLFLSEIPCELEIAAEIIE